MKEPKTYRDLAGNAESQAEAQLKEDALLLLSNLAVREEATVKMILDCLYDVGAVKLVNHKVNVRLLRGPLKRIANVSKPVFRQLAWQWFKKNCPELINDWLFDQVSFDQPSLPAGEDKSTIEVLPLPEDLSPLVEQQAAEILSLRKRLGWLTEAVVLLGVVVCFSTVFLVVH